MPPETIITTKSTKSNFLLSSRNKTPACTAYPAIAIMVKCSWLVLNQLSQPVNSDGLLFFNSDGLVVFDFIAELIVAFYSKGNVSLTEDKF